MSEELRKCPFCGGEAQVVGSWLNDVTSRKHSNLYAIQCGSAENCPAKNYEQDEQGGFACDFYTVEEAVTNWNTRPIEDELQKRIDELTAENAALREQVRWIPVSERLPELKTCASREDIICPEDYTIVITVDDKGYVSPAYFSYDGMFLDDYETPAEPMVYGKTLFFSECLDYSSEIINNVTHWMPLPQPPEGE